MSIFIRRSKNYATAPQTQYISMKPNKTTNFLNKY